MAKRIPQDRAVFMISVAAELAGMHPQTMRIYEERGLITPQRSPKGTRLYSQLDVDRLRRIQEMTVELGMNLAGVERVFALEREIESMSRRLERLRTETDTQIEAMRQELDRAQRSLRAEIVPYQRAGALIRAREVRQRQI